jgi:hypothetical protein
MKISGFTFGHNLIDSGYPIIEAIQAVGNYVDEIVFVDMQSTDTTRQVIEIMGCQVIDGEWDNQAGETLARAHALHIHCKNDTILHFEADEVYDDDLAYEAYYQIQLGLKDLAVRRLQIEQNFQRIRWYPEPVHRVFQKGTVKKVGHTTDLHTGTGLPIVAGGFLWDCTNCFRDNWFNRVEKQAELWNEEPKYRYVPLHFNQPIELHREQAHFLLSEPHWTFPISPLALPDSLQDLVGVTKYSDSEGYRNLIG